MNTQGSSMWEQKIEALAADYKRAGFEVIREPQPGVVPIDLGNYLPDLVAKKGDSGVVMEVRTGSSRLSIEPLQAVAQAIAEHPGWRFMLVTLDDVEADAFPATSADLPDWEQITQKLETVDALLANGLVEPAILYLCSVVEAALRRRAITRSIPVERLPADVLLNHLYSQGEVSVDEIDCMHELLDKRNRLSHGMQVPLEPELVARLVQAVRNMIGDWCDEERSDHGTRAAA
jgi:hypothetical protein